MRTKVLYNGKGEHSDYSTFNFVINGKGDYGNGEYWNEEEEAVAISLANYISENTDSPEPSFEGDTVWFSNSNEDGIMDWKEEVLDAYREWKKSVR